MASVELKVQLALLTVMKPLAGPELIVTAGAMVSTVIARLTTGPMLPIGSIARTSKVWAPSDRPVWEKGEVQVVNAAGLVESKRHWKVAVPSVELKVQLALLTVMKPLAGPELIVTAGATVSTVIVRVAGVASTLPAGSMARTSKVCEPSLRPMKLPGELQVVNAAGLVESIRHWNVAVPSGELKAQLALAVAMVPVGPLSMFVSGTTASVTKDREAGEASVFPAGSIALT